MNDWNIQSRAHACEACGRTFADQEAYHTLLSEEKADLRRSDICAGCWEKQFSEGARDRKGFISYWQGIYEAPPPVVDPIHKDTAETLLRKLIEQNDPRHLPAAYILAVMLERKRVLKQVRTEIANGDRLLIYEHRENGDVFIVRDPQLRLSELELVQDQVATLLRGGAAA